MQGTNKGHTSELKQFENKILSFQKSIPVELIPHVIKKVKAENI